MTKKSKKILVIVALLLVLVSIVLLVAPTHKYSSAIHNVIEVTDGVASPGSFKTVLTVKSDGKYVFSANWWKEDELPGFVTALKVTDEAGKVMYTVTGGSLFSDSVPMELKAGKYYFGFEILADSEAYNEYVKNNFSDPETGEVDAGIFRDGVWEMDYKVEINPYIANLYALGVAAGAAVGILIVALVAVLAKKEDVTVGKYDERQIAAQGKAYKYGFYTLLAFLAVLTVVYFMKINIPVEPSLMMIITIVVGGVVTMTVLIMEDAYFRLDESKNRWIIFFLLIAVGNLGLGILRIVSGEAVVDGVATFDGFVNLICGLFMAYMLVLVLIKSIRDKEED